jgi:hypothetical protein
MEKIIDITKLQLILGKLFYLATACSHSPSARLKYKISKCNKQRVRRDVRLRAESKHTPTPFFYTVKTAVVARMELNAVMQKGSSEQRCELLDKIMFLCFKSYLKNHWRSQHTREYYYNQLVMENMWSSTKIIFDAQQQYESVLQEFFSFILFNVTNLI